MWLIFFIVLQSTALDPITSAIEQAQSLAVKKNRKEACALLNRSFTATPVHVRGRSKLLESLNQVSRMFFTDKGQKLYESSQVLMFENADLALNQLREAQTLEDENILVLANIARIQILKQDCDAALVTMEMARSLHPYATENMALEIRAFWCAKRYDLLKERLKAFSSTEKWEQSFSQYILAQDQLRQKSPGRAFEILQKITEDHPQFPEAYYQLAQAGKALEKTVTPYLERYSSLCKAITPRDRKKYALEPQLCIQLKDVDNELAKIRSEG